MYDFDVVCLLFEKVNHEMLNQTFWGLNKLELTSLSIQFEFWILSVFGQYSAKDESFLSSYSTFFLPCESFG